MMKKFRPFLLLLCALALVSAACGDSDDDTSTTTAASSDAEMSDEMTDGEMTDGEMTDEMTDDDMSDEAHMSDDMTDGEMSDDMTDGEMSDEMTDGEMTDGVAAAFPVTIGETTIETEPVRIVSMSATATEMLFAIGAGDQVVAVDDQSNYPPEAPMTDLSGFTPNVEEILGENPDLVVLSFDPGEIVSGLTAAGVPTLVYGPAVTLDDSYTQIEQLGVATGNVGGAVEVVANMTSDLEALAAAAPTPGEPVTYYHELDSTLYSVTSNTFIGEIYALAGLTSVADAADPDGELGGFPQMNPEFLLENDPDFIMLADTKCCGESAETVAARPGWDALSAVQNGNVVELDDDIASRWGPRVVDFLEVILETTSGAVVPAEG
jgi:iron complex transport system substrate-binding protein